MLIDTVNVGDHYAQPTADIIGRVVDTPLHGLLDRATLWRIESRVSDSICINTTSFCPVCTNFRISYPFPEICLK